MSTEPGPESTTAGVGDPDAAMMSEGSPVDPSEATRPPTDDIIAKAEEARAAFARAGGMDEEEVAGPPLDGHYEPGGQD